MQSCVKMILKLALNCANAKTIKRQWALMIMAENKASEQSEQRGLLVK